MALWIEPRFPGDAVRMLLLKRGKEIGDIRIQAYNARSFRVAAFLPGVNVSFPGDTPKVEPENSCFRMSTYAADEAFDLYVQRAYEDGWQNREE